MTHSSGRELGRFLAIGSMTVLFALSCALEYDQGVNEDSDIDIAMEEVGTDVSSEPCNLPMGELEEESLVAGADQEQSGVVEPDGVDFGCFLFCVGGNVSASCFDSCVSCVFGGPFVKAFFCPICAACSAGLGVRCVRECRTPD